MNDIPLSGFLSMLRPQNTPQQVILYKDGQEYPVQIKGDIPEEILQKLQQAMHSSAEIPLKVESYNGQKQFIVTSESGAQIILQTKSAQVTLPPLQSQIFLKILSYNNSLQNMQLTAQLAPPQTQSNFPSDQLALSQAKPLNASELTQFTLPKSPINSSQNIQPQLHKGYQSQMSIVQGQQSTVKILTSAPQGSIKQPATSLLPNINPPIVTSQSPSPTASVPDNIITRIVLKNLGTLAPHGQMPATPKTQPSQIQTIQNIIQTRHIGSQQPTLLSSARAGEQIALITAHSPKGDTTLGLLGFDTPHKFQSVYSAQTSGILYTGKMGLQNINSGSLLQITPQSISTSPIKAIQHPQFPDIPEGMNSARIWGPDFFRAENWSILQDAIETIAQVQPSLAQAIVASVPSPAQPTQMMPSILFFMAAIKGGNLGEWIGEKGLKILESSGSDKLLSQIKTESQVMARLGSDTQGAEWKSYALPLGHEGDMFKMALHVRDDGGRNNADTDKNAHDTTRFIFDLKLPRMGALQLDGLFQNALHSQNSSQGQLDVVLRTENHFSKAMRQEMRKIYASAMEKSRLYGELHFSTEEKKLDIY